MDFGVSAFLVKLFEKNWILAVVLFVGFFAWKILSQYLPIYAERAKIKLNSERDRVSSLERQVFEYQAGLTNHLSSIIPILDDMRMQIGAGAAKGCEAMDNLKAEAEDGRRKHDEMQRSMDRIEGAMGGHAGPQ